MSTDFSVSLEPPWNGSHIVRVGGDLDLAHVGQLSDFLARLDGHVRIDCTELSIVDASGIRGLVEAAASLTSLRLVNVPRELRWVFESTAARSLLASASVDSSFARAGVRQRRLDRNAVASTKVHSTQEVTDAHTL